MNWFVRSRWLAAAVTAAGAAFFLALMPATAQQTPMVVPATAPSAPSAPVEEIIRRFAAKESEFAKARENYTYRQTVRIQELDNDGAIRGRYEIISDIIFSPQGKRLERVVRAPVSTLHLIITPADEQDLRNVQPWVCTTETLSKYNVSYLGPQKVDELETYVFSVKPKALESGQRYFEGQIWVDQRDMQIVKTFGKGVGVRKKNDDNQFPRFETYRDQIDGKYWFPILTRADDVLHFKDYDQRIRMSVKYEDYKQFRAETGIQYEGVIEDKDKDKDKPKPKK